MRKLHNEELNDLYSSPNIVRGDKIEKNEMGGASGTYGGRERCAQGFGGGKRPLGRPRRRREDCINVELQEVEGGCGDWMELAEDRDRWRALVSTVMNFRVP